MKQRIGDEEGLGIDPDGSYSRNNPGRICLQGGQPCQKLLWGEGNLDKLADKSQLWM